MIKAVIFDDEQEFFLGEIEGEKVSVYKCDFREKMEKYDPIVRLIYDFEQKFGKNVTCWEKVVTYGSDEIYAVRIDMDEIYEKIEESDRYVLVSLQDMVSMEEVSREARWMVMMSLDTNVRNKFLGDAKKEDSENLHGRRHFQRHTRRLR